MDIERVNSVLARAIMGFQDGELAGLVEASFLKRVFKKGGKDQKSKDKESVKDDGVVWRTTKSGHTIGIDPEEGDIEKGNPHHPAVKSAPEPERVDVDERGQMTRDEPKASYPKASMDPKKDAEKLRKFAAGMKKGTKPSKKVQRMYDEPNLGPARDY